MDDAASPSTTARLDDNPEPSQCPDAEADAESGPDPSPSRRSPSRRHRKKRKGKKRTDPGLMKKLAFVTHLLNSLDVLVFAELSSLYYMECVYLLSQELS